MGLSPEVGSTTVVDREQDGVGVGRVQGGPVRAQSGAWPVSRGTAVGFEVHPCPPFPRGHMFLVRRLEVPGAQILKTERNLIVVRLILPAGRIAAACFLLVASSACDLLGPSGPSGPGWLCADLESPNGQEGAAVLELAGGRGLGTVSLDGGDVFYELDGSTIRIVVVMDTPGTIHLEIRTDDVARVPSVAVVQVADGENRLRSSLAGYRLSFTKVPDGSEGGEP